MGSENPFIGELEQMILLAVARLGDGAYGRAIRQELEARTGRRVSHGAAYVTLDRLASKGYVSSTVGDPNPGRGGRPKRYFRVTREGARALLESHRAFTNLWEGLDGVLEEA
ncbi:MAG: PadR family transcriptional regulator [Gemmatimonadota bacterium]|jgi:DNA-binding PadR family transcriptional regulator